MLVRDAMTAGARIAEPDEFLPHAAKKMRTQGVGALPVVEGGRLVGMLTDRDIAVRAVADHKDPTMTKVREVMSEDCFSCAVDATLEEAAQTMREMAVRRLPVVDADEKIIGMLSVEDIARVAPPDIAGGVLKAVAATAQNPASAARSA